jgi:hypothetical protein
MSQIEMLKNQVLEEILREKAGYYYSKDKKIDFWISIAPSFLEDITIKNKIKETNFYKQQKDLITSNRNNKEFYSALISVDEEFLRWVKLRLGYFENITEPNQLLNPNIISDGLCGSLSSDTLESTNFFPLRNRKNFINPEILVNKYKKSVDLYYLNN